MLRRKLILILGVLLTLMMVMAVTAVWLLQGVLTDMEGSDRQTADAANRIAAVERDIAVVEMELYQLQMGQKRHLDVLLGAVDSLRQSVEALDASAVLRAPEIGPRCRELGAQLPDFERAVGSMATAENPDLAAMYNRQAFAAALKLHHADQELALLARQHEEQLDAGISTRMRKLVVGVTIGFLALINVTILLLVRAAGLILGPMHKLVHASRELAREHFEHRVHLAGHDEFDELARAFNQLAENLQASEARKVEMLQQTALTLNHELNNALAIIETQLALLSRRATDDPAFAKCLRQIHQNLDRMKHTVALLRQVRRIVLTDYTQGVKMLDLERSADPQPRAGVAAENPSPAGGP
jgi:nitrate/nitrite-specific signal transduction histidine kinase